MTDSTGDCVYESIQIHGADSIEVSLQMTEGEAALTIDTLGDEIEMDDWIPMIHDETVKQAVIIASLLTVDGGMVMPFALARELPGDDEKNLRLISAMTDSEYVPVTTNEYDSLTLESVEQGVEYLQFLTLFGIDVGLVPE